MLSVTNFEQSYFIIGYQLWMYDLCNEFLVQIVRFLLCVIGSESSCLLSVIHFEDTFVICLGFRTKLIYYGL
jgi:hypothetical protein